MSLTRFDPPPNQRYCVCTFITAHPDNLERAEAEVFSKFIREQLPKFVNGEGFTTLIKEYPSETPKIKVYDQDNPPPEEPAPEPVKRTVFDFTPEELVQEYAMWKLVNQISLQKHLEETLGKVPHRRIIKVYGAYKNKEKADAAAAQLQRDDDSFPYYVCPMNQPLPMDPMSIQCKTNHNSNEQLTELLSDYERNQQETEQIMLKSKDKTLHNLLVDNKEYIKQIKARGLPDIGNMQL